MYFNTMLGNPKLQAQDPPLRTTESGLGFVAGTALLCEPALVEVAEAEGIPEDESGLKRFIGRVCRANRATYAQEIRIEARTHDIRAAYAEQARDQRGPTRQTWCAEKLWDKIQVPE